MEKSEETKKLEISEIKKKIDSYSLISFVLTIIFIIITFLFLSIYIFSYQKMMVRVNPYTAQEITQFIFSSILFFILPFLVVLILAIIGYKRTSKDQTLKGKGMAITALVISIIYLTFALIFIVAESNRMITFEGYGQNCRLTGGICTPANECTNPMSNKIADVKFDCELRDMICCQVNQ